MKINARKMALRLLEEIENEKEFSHVVINSYFEQYDLESVDRRFISFLVLGILENKMLLDYYIRKFSKQRFGKIPNEIVIILRMGIYQIKFMSKVPNSAAVDESVKLAKKVSAEYGKFVNGILRNFIREGENIQLPDKKRHPATYLSVLYSHPEWLVSKWIKQYGQKFTEELLRSNNQRPNLSLRVNTLKTSPDLYKEKLRAANIGFDESKILKQAVLLNNLNELSVSELPGYTEGEFQIQDESSMLASVLANPKPGDMVIDVCSAPGGKATHIAELMGNKGLVHARDISENKLKIVEENIKRLGAGIINLKLYDAISFDTEIGECADVVLVDAPCSGLGIIRRKPDIKYNKSEEELIELSMLQKQILETSSKYVKKGGTLLYSTCTINSDENEDVINWFLSKNPEFKLASDIEEINQKTINKMESILNKTGLDLILKKSMITLYPHVHGTDGFFMAKMIKII